MKKGMVKSFLAGVLSVFALTSVYGTAALAETTPVLEEQEIYNQDGVKVTVTGLDSGWMGTEIGLLIENDSEKNITVQARNVSVNDYMVDSMMSSDVASGKKANDTLTLLTSDFDSMGIDTIAEIEFSFHIFSEEDWSDFTDSDLITLTTQGNEDYQQEFDDSGELLYENHEIKIVSRGISDDSIMGKELMLYVENNSDTDVTVQAGDTSVNGFMIDPIMSIEVPAGKHALDGMTFLQSYLDDNKIETIETIETAFHIFETDTYSTIEDTDAIGLQMQE